MCRFNGYSESLSLSGALGGGLGFTRGQPCEPSELSCYRLVRKVNALLEIDREVVGTVADTVAVRVFYLSQ